MDQRWPILSRWIALISSDFTSHVSKRRGAKHLFQGQLWTQQTWLNDYRNRVELPTMGVFLQPDPIGFKGDAANLYRFCRNNPVNKTDPLGLDPVETDSAVDRFIRHASHVTLNLSRSNSDHLGVGLERAKAIERQTGSGKLRISENTGVGTGKPFSGPQKIYNMPLQADDGTRIIAFTHAHTHDSQAAGLQTMMTQGDRGFADYTGKPFYTIARGRQGEAIERYRPSDAATAPRERKREGGVAETFNGKDWKSAGGGSGANGSSTENRSAENSASLSAATLDSQLALEMSIGNNSREGFHPAGRP
jgi:RHS repeat-associated protein